MGVCNNEKTALPRRRLSCASIENGLLEETEKDVRDLRNDVGTRIISKSSNIYNIHCTIPPLFT
jgi:hypothetical protein